MIIAAACGGLTILYTSRKRAARAAAEAQLARARAARNRVRVPDVSNNVKGVTASQTISPYKPEEKGRAA
jgi:hypothetical protein